MARLLGRAQTAVDGGLEKVPPGRRRPVIAAAAAAIVVLLFVFAGTYVAGRGDSDAAPAAPPPFAGNVPAARNLIPPEELFLPEEPDFVPGVILGRERRAEWTADDAEPWWQNPLAEGEEQWRSRIEGMIDEIMESVP